MATNENLVDETNPLLPRPNTFAERQVLAAGARPRTNSVASLLARGRSNTIDSLRTTYAVVRRHRTGFAFILFVTFLVYCAFVLAFLPSTSISRDFRRLHFAKVTKDEAYRLFVTSLLWENYAKGHMRHIASKNHPAGDSRALKYTMRELRAYGLNPVCETYYPYFNTPIRTEVSIWTNGLEAEKLSTWEDVLDQSQSTNISVAGFHGYSADGDVTAAYVYCGYGSAEEYFYLLQNGIQLAGKVHIVREGRLHPGQKIRYAEAYGAVGVITYSDSCDDGNVTTVHGYAPYPFGPAAHPSRLRRDSVLFSNEIPGDPTTPGSVPWSPRTRRQLMNARVPRIPSVPISEREASKLLKLLNGKGVRVGLGGNTKGFDYHSGPSDSNVQVRVLNRQNYGMHAITNVIAEVPGILKDQEVVIGANRDSWAVGAGESASATSILLEIARGLGAARKKGWKPLRSIKLISWDGEELGLLGSTSHGAAHNTSISDKTIAYFNLGNPVTGTDFECEAHPLVAGHLLDASKATNFKEKFSDTLYDYWRNQSNLSIASPVSSSSYATFQHHLGVPSAECRFVNNRKDDAIHHGHSSYDTYTWMEKLLDPDYELHNTLAMFVGLSALMLAENELVPFRTTDYMIELWRIYEDLHQPLKKAFLHNEEVCVLYSALSSQLQLAAFHTAVSFDAFTASVRSKTIVDYPWWKLREKLRIYNNLTSSNRRMKLLDRIFIKQLGLAGRPWMKHTVFAPAGNNCANCTMLPGLSEAIHAKDANSTIKWLKSLSTQVDRVISLLTV
ncbi:AER157Cp [Eremothecium gossypii ATCC 10895]|uniref:AER157Cp n=1 Tax=Eremothecium gossypii (strain ATCC 10895 / CBS 109.51 / FGSC 9923 / NRRL Y-1056) TaxID=284811 RepID=Q756U5_EREGS|nr:AER157Cp [Eremothecium gossypii ATCC 10895]AAS52839.1 AER157Cp [Eremothecium gossypii ATCC 10895]